MSLESKVESKEVLIPSLPLVELAPSNSRRCQVSLCSNLVLQFSLFSFCLSENVEINTHDTEFRTKSVVYDCGCVRNRCGRN